MRREEEYAMLDTQIANLKAEVERLKVISGERDELITHKNKQIVDMNLQVGALKQTIREAHTAGYRHGMGPCVCEVCAEKRVDVGGKVCGLCGWEGTTHIHMRGGNGGEVCSQLAEDRERNSR